ncbi:MULTISPECIES: branched-chain amino acid ABC transporter permease [unclassified Streptomyces]|uniref:branched-chain amino acid ABC transporter permease n=1 Tax=unclassified Streptomyces TaxID=2593676 RepID=UPI002DDABB4B|nr:MULTISPECIES: branched-chain amino acid ABC transporter permease [unclassified Streptomyces]WSC36735.1 branched-chain amino acid ABC transporter permease [Streptomyces sp. NBC_01763]WSC44831.1 branched-chain amino acid ABC transporter permease [Streptomyces sp. NBC_01762]WSC56187.1 branched-chain amino acid ABC transporter permease [Streptomyces sp. NBC_01761]WSD24418.1 branched-chain amino acid ABC transporter permease [Streptomyces sp. NBC_01751]WSJ53557.1 branched-chain amino acid ABC tr
MSTVTGTPDRTSGTPAAPSDAPAADTARLLRWWPAAVLVVLIVAPYSALPLPGLLDGPVGSAGSLQLLATCLLFGALATGYDLLLGRTGLLSFGHALYFAAGSYATNTIMLEAGLPFAVSALVGVCFGIALALVLGSVSLRVTGIGFSMVTLAFAQAGSILVSRNPGGFTGGEEGRAAPAELLPSGLVGIEHTANLYWVALGYLVLTLAVVHWAVRSPTGRVWEGIKENERRVEVLGLRPYGFKLTAFVLAGALAALGGLVHLLLTGGSTPQTTTSDFTLSLLVMVVLGGSGTRWGPMVGGILYTWADHRLGDLAGSGAVADLPAVLRVPLSQPLFLLGVLFVAVVHLLPGGLARLPSRLGSALRAPGGATRAGAAARKENRHS